MSLSQAILPKLQEAGKLSVPKYDPKTIKAGILHIGVGNFHRSHLAAYMNDLFDKNPTGDNADWGIVGGGIMHFDAAKRDLLESQDWLQTIVEQDATTAKGIVIASMVDFLPVDHVNKQHKELQDSLASPNIKIVSMTVTEGGYYLSDGKFNLQALDIQHDVAAPTEPHTIFGMMVKALMIRKNAGVPPFTVLSCDNMPHNGAVVKSVMVQLAAAMHGEEFANWMQESVAFPSSMVDRITPGTTEATKAFVQETYGYADKAPIFCEPFRQWVIEDAFSAGRPAWEQLENVTIVKDVVPFETMKIRILNGGHASLCYPAALLGIEYIHEAMEHPIIGPFLDTLERHEIIPTVPPVPDTDLKEYWGLIAKRFANPVLQDTIGRNCYDGASRQPKFIVPTAGDGLKAGKSVDGLALVSAMWCRYCMGTTEAGETIPANDPQWDALQSKAQAAKKDPTVWLGMIDVYGDVGLDPVFKESFGKALTTIENKGVEIVMQEYIATRA